jgi:hypothetical protein
MNLNHKVYFIKGKILLQIWLKSNTKNSIKIKIKMGIIINKINNKLAEIYKIH